MIEGTEDIDLIKNLLKMALLFLNLQYLYSIINSSLKITGIILLFIFNFKIKNPMGLENKNILLETF